MVSEERTERVALRMTPTEAAMLRGLSDDDGLSLSDVIRQLIRREWASRHGAKKPKP